MKIDDEMLDYVGILAKLHLDEDERDKARADMEGMLAYIDKLKELDTDGIEPVSHIFKVSNVFREDTVVDIDGAEDLLSNAPEIKDRSLKAPKTI